MPLKWVQDRWQKMTTKPCDSCGQAIPITAYRDTGETRKGTWWAGGAVKLECPNCGAAFWTKK